MPRLIDADALIKELKQIVNTEQIFKSFTTWGNAYEDCMTMLDEAPTVDAVPVVRCKDCYWHNQCRYEQYLGLNGYCSKGEEKDA